MKVSIIGKKYDPNHPIPVDGGRLKVCLYEKKLCDEGCSTNVIDLFRWYFHLLRLFFQIRKAVKESDVIIIMGGPKGCRPLIFLCNFLNKQKHKRLVFVPLGIGTLDKLLKKKTPEQVNDFLLGRDRLSIRDERMKRELAKLDAIIPQNEVLVNAYQSFYCLKNVLLLRNFRDITRDFGPEAFIRDDSRIHLLFLSRITENKGIFDLLNSVSRASKKNPDGFVLDIYGELQLNENQRQLFDSYLSNFIVYKGTVRNDQIVGLCRKYDFMVFPTRYHGEGTPAVIIESLIAGTPVIVSSYSQAKSLISDGKNGFVFQIGNVDSLTTILLALCNGKKNFSFLRKNAFDSGSLYLYSTNRSAFVSSLLGPGVAQCQM